MDRTELLDSRIRWRVGRNFPSLPAGRTFFFEQLNQDLQSAIAGVAERHNAGKPVLAAVNSLDCWTFISTLSVVSQHSSKIHACNLSEIKDLEPRDQMPDGLSPEGHARWKSSWEYLRITDRADRDHDIWLPPGPEAFVFWSTLLMLGRMCAGVPSF